MSMGEPVELNNAAPSSTTDPKITTAGLYLIREYIDCLEHFTYVYISLKDAFIFCTSIAF